jgi:AraC-like DNA-binding protein
MPPGGHSAARVLSRRLPEERRSSRRGPACSIPASVELGAASQGEGLPFALSLAGYYSHAFGFAAHEHQDEYELHYVPRGRCTMLTGKHRLRLPHHSLTFTEPHTPHGIAKNEGEVQWYYFRFRVLPLGAPVLPALRRAFGPRSVLRLGPPFEQRFRDLLLRLNSPDPWIRLSGAHLFASLLFELAAFATAPRGLSSSRHVQSLVSWMQAHLSSPLKLAEAAAKQRISAAHLSRLFKAGTGSSPIHFFNRLKIDTASDLLRTTALPIKDIALELGFCDEFYFSRLFKQYRGVSPSSFREH